MRIVVTGAGGFIGWHLVDLLARRGDTVEAWLRRPDAGGGWPVKVDTVAVDLTDPGAVSEALARAAPEVVVHLAAQSFPARSWDEPARTYEVNVVGSLHLLEAVRRLPRPPRVLVAGSSAEYAEPADGQPIPEDAPTEPNSPYGASKLAVDTLVGLYGRRYELDLVRFRPFFLIGPRKTGDVASDFARQVVAIERGQLAEMRVGALDVVRDFMDVRDGAEAILKILESGQGGEVYNVCAGVGISTGSLLEALCGLATRPVSVVQDPALLRPLDHKIKIGDNRRLRALGWAPAHSLDETMRTILDYWRASPG